MNTEEFIPIWFALAAFAALIQMLITAPYGRHTSSHWGIMIPNRVGWWIMELPSLLIMSYFFLFGPLVFCDLRWILCVLWILHYVNRIFVYSVSIKSTPKKMPLMICLLGAMFNVINAALNGFTIAEIEHPIYDLEWVKSGRFGVGVLLFVVGMFVNIKSDRMLIQLRKEGEIGYKIPRGFLFEYISTPNLLGEIIEWAGYALMANTLPAYGFVMWTLATLSPRSFAHHRFYREVFEEYPKDRKALIPFLI